MKSRTLTMSPLKALSVFLNLNKFVFYLRLHQHDLGCQRKFQPLLNLLWSLPRSFLGDLSATEFGNGRRKSNYVFSSYGIYLILTLSRTSSVVSVPQLRSSWKVKEERRQQLKNMKEREKMIRDEKQKAYEEQRERIKRNREMREKNALKNVKYQIVCF